MLPREPIKQMALAVGLPLSIVTAWHQGLSQLSRRFQVCGSLGGSTLSTCGYPEGCALSVVAMLLVNMTCQLWLTHRLPAVQVWSFVDNIETVAQSAPEAVQSLESLQAFCQLMELPIDAAKTYCWSTSSEGRQTIQGAEFNTQLFGRDLGGHMNYCRVRTNQTIQVKIDQMTQFWSRLARTAAPLRQKERSLYVSAWPNIFYGISTVVLGKCHFTKLRTKATRALQVNQHGSNPRLQLSCVSDPRCDPEFYSILHTLIAFRNHSTPDLAQPTMDHVLSGGRTSQGPCTSVLNALAKLTWTWEGNGWCQDHEHLPIQMLHCPNGEFYQRIVQAWQFSTLAWIEEIRPTMQGAKHTDVALTQQCMQSFAAEKQALLRCILNGTQFTNNALAHAGTVASASCSFCEARDSLHHRIWECPFFQDIRDRHQLSSHIPADAPQSFGTHGWLPVSPHLRPFRAALQTIPDSTADFMVGPQPATSSSVTDLFLDGSCIHPANAAQRVATWGLVMWDGQSFQYVANGGVPGWQQTSLRGEILAALAALKFAAVFRCKVRLWIDNLTVFNFLTALQSGHQIRWQSRKDADLWEQLARQFSHSR